MEPEEKVKLTADYKGKFERFCYKWLPIVFGCHCRPDRSFFYKGRQFPICARCTGVLVGMIAGIASAFFLMPKLYVCGLMMLPMIIDGGVQKATGRESTNIRRFITGCLFGFALIFVIIKFLAHGYRKGRSLGLKIFSK